MTPPPLTIPTPIDTTPLTDAELMRVMGRVQYLTEMGARFDGDALDAKLIHRLVVELQRTREAAKEAREAASRRAQEMAAIRADGLSVSSVRAIVDDCLERNDTSFGRMVERLREAVIAQTIHLAAQRDSWRLCHDELARAAGLAPEASHAIVLGRVKAQRVEAEASRAAEERGRREATSDIRRYIWDEHARLHGAGNFDAAALCEVLADGIERGDHIGAAKAGEGEHDE